MKQIEKVSIGGYAFTLDDQAAAACRSYLGELENHYNGTAGGREILDGIEERMAELLLDRAGADTVVTAPAIEAVIAILGRPEDIEEGDSPDEPANDGSKSGEARPKRKLYRDMADKQLAGVCSGLGTYFNVDSALFRILFVVFTLLGFFGWGRHGIHIWCIHLGAPLIYAILWVCIPAARTAQQRWEQKGEDGTLQGIQKRVQESANEMGEALRTVGQSPAWQRFGSFFSKGVGLVLLIAGFAGLFACGLLGIGSGATGRVFGLARGADFMGLRELYHQGMDAIVTWIPEVGAALTAPLTQGLVMIVVFLPFLGILYGGLQLLFGFKSPKWHPGLVIFILWLLACVALAITLFTGVVAPEMITL